MCLVASLYLLRAYRRYVAKVNSKNAVELNSGMEINGLAVVDVKLRINILSLRCVTRIIIDD